MWNKFLFSLEDSKGLNLISEFENIKVVLEYLQFPVNVFERKVNFILKFSLSALYLLGFVFVQRSISTVYYLFKNENKLSLFVRF